MEYPKKCKEKGFTLVELLIAMALALIIIGSLASSFVSQRKSYAIQEQIAEMNQNARAAMDMMSRDIMMTGYGIARSNYNSLSAWIDWHGLSGKFANGPVVLETGSGALGSDIVYVAGCITGTAATLNSSVLPGATAIQVTPVDPDKSVSQLFDTNDEKLISIDALENAIVRGVSGSTLTLSAGLGMAHRSGAEVCVVKVVTYSIVDDGGGAYTLKRNENLGGGRQPLAENIVDLKSTIVMNAKGNIIGLTIDPLIAQTDLPDPDYSENQGHRRDSFRCYLTPPNLVYGEK
jgi:prepilin-type N-terminal cleavage/methylation domain-containing protein